MQAPVVDPQHPPVEVRARQDADLEIDGGDLQHASEDSQSSGSGSRKANRSKLAVTKPMANKPKSAVPKPPKLVSAKILRSRAEPSGATRTHLTKEDYANIVTWLENPPNLTAIEGTSGKTSVGRGMKGSAQGFRDLGAYVTWKSGGRLKLDGKAMRERFARYKKLYVDTRALFDHTGFGVTEKDAKKGIFLLSHKLESECPHYDRMHALFGGKANIEPPVEYDHSLAGEYSGQAIADDSEEEYLTPRVERIGTRREEDEVVPRDNQDDMYLDSMHRSDQDVSSDDNEADNSVFLDAPSELAIHGSKKAEEISSRKRRASSVDIKEPTRRSRGTDVRKAPPKVETGLATSTSKNSFATVYHEAALKKAEGNATAML